jgi:archaellum component FlaC
MGERLTQTECELRRLYGSHENKDKPISARFCCRIENQLYKEKLKIESLKHLLDLQDRSVKKLKNNIRDLGKKINQLNNHISKLKQNERTKRKKSPISSHEGDATPN